MKLWVDEDLPPSLVDTAREHGLDAACNRDRGRLGGSDVEILKRCIEEDRALVTNNYGDFRRLCERESIHPGVIVMPTPARAAQQELLQRALTYIDQQVAQGRAHDAGEFMINRVVEVAEDGACEDYLLPDIG